MNTKCHRQEVQTPLRLSDTDTDSATWCGIYYYDSIYIVGVVAANDRLCVGSIKFHQVGNGGEGGTIQEESAQRIDWDVIRNAHLTEFSIEKEVLIKNESNWETLLISVVSDERFSIKMGFPTYNCSFKKYFENRIAIE